MFFFFLFVIRILELIIIRRLASSFSLALWLVTKPYRRMHRESPGTATVNLIFFLIPLKIYFSSCRRLIEVFFRRRVLQSREWEWRVRTWFSVSFRLKFLFLIFIFYAFECELWVVNQKEFRKKIFFSLF